LSALVDLAAVRGAEPPRLLAAGAERRLPPIPMGAAMACAWNARQMKAAPELA
jgi:hypothetical protein